MAELALGARFDAAAVETGDLEFGLLLASTSDPAAEAVAAERHGFDLVATGEHISFHHATPNSLISLAAASAVTERVGLMTAIALAPVYPPVLLAKMASALACMSGGRFELGLGIGGENPAELEACGIAPAQRGARTSEAIEIMQRLWRAEAPDAYRGPFTTYQDIQIQPAPPGGREAFNQDFTEIIDAFCLIGSPDKVRARLEEYIDAGATRVIFSPCATDAQAVDDTRRLAAEAVLPAFHSRRKARPASRA